MTTTLNATTSNGLVVTPDNSGNILLQYNGQSAPSFSAYSNTAQTFVNGVEQKVTFAVENWDTNNNFASSRFTPTVAGYYQFVFQAGGTFSSSLNGTYISLYKNGTYYSIHNALSTSGAFIAGNQLYAQGSNIVYMNGSTDYVEVYGYWAGSGTFTMNTNSFATFFTGCLLRGA